MIRIFIETHIFLWFQSKNSALKRSKSVCFILVEHTQKEKKGKIIFYLHLYSLYIIYNLEYLKTI